MERRLLAVGAALVLPLAAGLAVSLAALSRVPLDSAAPAEPIVDTVRAAQRSATTEVTVALQPAPRVPIRTQATGLITELNLPLGQAPEPGQVVLRVDGLPRYAYLAPAPWHRAIAPGMQGADVDQAVALLRALGHVAAAEPSDAELAAAIAAFNAAAGSTGEALSPESVVWFPDGAVLTEQVAHVGDAAGPQTQLATALVGVDQISVATEAADQPRTLSLAGIEAELPADAVTITAPADVAALREQLAQQLTATAQLSSPSGSEVGVIPASAVVTDASGRTCFFPGVDEPGIAIAATDGSFGRVEVPAELVGRDALVNPRQVLGDASCG